MEVTLDIVVRSTELDIRGHVNNAKYLDYLEWGREEWYDTIGLPHHVLDQMQIHTVIVNITINYRKECWQNDRLTIRTKPEKIGRSSFVLRQELYNQHGELCADAAVTIVTVDVQTRRSTEVPGAMRRLFSR